MPPKRSTSKPAARSGKSAGRKPAKTTVSRARTAAPRPGRHHVDTDSYRHRFVGFVGTFTIGEHTLNAVEMVQTAHSIGIINAVVVPGVTMQTPKIVVVPDGYLGRRQKKHVFNVNESYLIPFTHFLGMCQKDIQLAFLKAFGLSAAKINGIMKHHALPKFGWCTHLMVGDYFLPHESVMQAILHLGYNIEEHRRAHSEAIIVGDHYSKSEYGQYMRHMTLDEFVMLQPIALKVKIHVIIVLAVESVDRFCAHQTPQQRAQILFSAQRIVREEKSKQRGATKLTRGGDPSLDTIDTNSFMMTEDQRNDTDPTILPYVYSTLI